MQLSTDATKKKLKLPLRRMHVHLAIEVVLHLLAGQEHVIKAQESRDDGPMDKEVFVAYLPQPWPSKSSLVNGREGWDAPLPAAGIQTCRF